MAIEHSRPIKKSARKPTLVDRVYESLHYRQFHWIAINASRKEYLSQMLTHVWNLMRPHPFAKIRPGSCAE